MGSAEINYMEEALGCKAAELCEGVGVIQKVRCLYTLAAQIIPVQLLIPNIYTTAALIRVACVTRHGKNSTGLMVLCVTLQNDDNRYHSHFSQQIVKNTIIHMRISH